MTRTPLSRSKGQGHQAALLSAVLTRQAAAAVSVRTYWPWETAATLPSARRRKALRRPWGRRGAGHIVAVARLQPVIIGDDYVVRRRRYCDQFSLRHDVCVYVSVYP